LNENEPEETKYFYDLNENQYNFKLEYASGGKTYRIKEQNKNKKIINILILFYHLLMILLLNIEKMV